MFLNKHKEFDQTLSVNLEDISDINRKERQKSEKNIGKREQFLWSFSKLFFNKLYFSHRGYIS